jgi:hypothetical protein
VSMNKCFTHPSSTVAYRRQSPREFGAEPGRQWPEIAVRRFMLYEVFLHELGHLQVVLPRARRVRRRFASETKAEEFAIHWRRLLWAEQFVHNDPIHNRPTEDELRVEALNNAVNCENNQVSFA